MVFQKGHQINLNRIQTKETREKIGKAFKNKTYEEIMGKEKAKKLKKEKGEKYKGKGNPFYNKKHSLQSKRLQSETHQGEKHPQWKGGISYYEKQFRRKIRKRDNYICMVCQIHQEKLNCALDVHHINYDKTLHILQNGISLCHSCHSKVSGDIFNRKHWIKLFQSILTERYNYRYLDNKIILTLKQK